QGQMSRSSAAARAAATSAGKPARRAIRVTDMNAPSRRCLVRLHGFGGRAGHQQHPARVILATTKPPGRPPTSKPTTPPGQHGYAAGPQTAGHRCARSGGWGWVVSHGGGRVAFGIVFGLGGSFL